MIRNSSIHMPRTFNPCHSRAHCLRAIKNKLWLIDLLCAQPLQLAKYTCISHLPTSTINPCTGAMHNLGQLQVSWRCWIRLHIIITCTLPPPALHAVNYPVKGYQHFDCCLCSSDVQFMFLRRAVSCRKRLATSKLCCMRLRFSPWAASWAATTCFALKARNNAST